MKKILLALILLVGGAAAQTAEKPAGDGSQANPYQVATLENLYWLSQTPDEWDKYYKQTADIDASVTQDWDNGAGFSPIGYFISYSDRHYFTGHYNGKGHKIDGLTINRPSADYVGLFGYLDNASIDSLGLLNASVEGNSYVGGISGYDNYSSVTYCFVAGTVKGNGSGVGAIIGKSDNGGSLDYSYATGSVSGLANVGGLVGYSFYDSKVDHSYAEVAVTGTTRVGGLVGSNSGSEIYNSYATGSVVGQDTVGGLVGKYDCNDIQYSYSSGKVSGNTLVGGFIGYSNNGCHIADTYYSTETSGQSAAMGLDNNSQSVTALTSAQMQVAQNFAGFDFTDTWVIYAGHTMPLLRAFLKPLTVSVADTAKTYDGQAFAGGKLVYSLANADATQILGTPSFAGTAQGAVNAGAYAYTVNSGLYSSQQGYLIGYSAASAALTVAKARLTITASDLKLTLGTKLPTTFPFVYQGFVNKENASVVTGLTATASCGPCQEAGNFSITPSGASATNYTISYGTGELSVVAPTSVVNRQLPERNPGNAPRWDLLGRTP